MHAGAHKYSAQGRLGKIGSAASLYTNFPDEQLHERTSDTRQIPKLPNRLFGLLLVSWAARERVFLLPLVSSCPQLLDCIVFGQQACNLGARQCTAYIARYV